MQNFADDVVLSIPRLTSYARRLACNRSLADDLVQETVLRALGHAEQFERGTNLLAWMSTILRNCYFNQCRASRRLTSIEVAANLPIPAIDCPQESRLQLKEFNGRLATLPAPQREAIMLVAVEGYSYEVAAQKAGCAVGTMKSRVSRARTELESETVSRHRSVAANQADFDHLDKVA